MMRNTSGGVPLRQTVAFILDKFPGITSERLVEAMHFEGFHNYTLTQARRAVGNYKRKKK